MKMLIIILLVSIVVSVLRGLGFVSFDYFLDMLIVWATVFFIVKIDQMLDGV